MTAGFHDIRFPLSISSESRGGPQRRTDVVTLRSGGEQRNSIWLDSLRKYQAGPGVKTIAQVEQVVAFFEERRGRLYGFRWRDNTDCQSSTPGQPVSSLDQPLGIGNGSSTTWQLVKVYGHTFAPWTRLIRKPVAGSVVVALNGVALAPTAFGVDTTTGLVVLATAPAAAAVVTAGFRFDVPVRFDTDYIELTMMPKFGGSLNIPIVEVRV